MEDLEKMFSGFPGVFQVPNKDVSGSPTEYFFACLLKIFKYNTVEP